MRFGGDAIMTTQAEQLLGAQVTGADGKVIGTVEQVFANDADGAPAWARVHFGKTSRFVPLGSSQVTEDGLNVSFDAQKIVTSPKIEVDQQMSADQADELGRYYDLEAPERTQERGKSDEAQRRAKPDEAQQRAKPDEAQQPGQADEAQQRDRSDEDWLLRREERLRVGKEMTESGHVKLHRYVDQEPAEQTVELFHEEYDVERMPVAADEPPGGNIEEGEQDITLHEERGILSKETVPVERMRLVTERVGQDETFRDDIRRERIEVEPEEMATGGGTRNKSRS
jgi:uncharacterized protein (TIGR02271 family)